MSKVEDSVVVSAVADSSPVGNGRTSGSSEYLAIQEPSTPVVQGGLSFDPTEDDEGLHRTDSYNVAVAGVSPVPGENTLKKSHEDGEEGREGKATADGKVLPFGALFRYATPAQRRWLWVAVICSLVQGGGMPAWTVVFGEQLNAFKPSEDDLVEELKLLLWVSVVLGVFIGLLAAVSVYILDTVGAAIAVEARTRFVHGVLSNDATWHAREENRPAKLKTRLDKATLTLQAATSAQLNFAVMGAGMFVAGLAFSFYYSWKLTLVYMVAIPLEMTGYAMLADMMAKTDAFHNKIYEEGSRIADEVLTLIRSVKLFNAIAKEVGAYTTVVQQAAARGRARGVQFGLALSLTDPMEFFLYALGFWYGARLIREGEVEVGDILIAMYCTLTGVMGLATIGGYVEQSSKARSSTSGLYAVADHKTSIDGLDANGLKPKAIQTGVTFDNVSFAYPMPQGEHARYAVNHLSFSVGMGETIALVGKSGSGKSTVASLLLRLFDPQHGTISIDGIPLPQLNVQWLRTTVGLVNQQPTLLPGTIHDNIAVGKHGATRDDVVAAAILANAHDFIMSFEDGYDANVGSLGNTLSGGQQQRIAIARTLIGEPPVLILDEATAALDSRSEGKLQRLLESTKGARATIVIAHRLSTIRNVDRIFVLDNGSVIESGSPDELLEQQGAYYAMVMQQGVTRAKSAEDDEEDDDFVDAAAASKRKSAAAIKPLQDKPVETETKPKREASESDASAWAWALAKRHKGWLAVSLVAAFVSGLAWPATIYLLVEMIKISQGFFEGVNFSCDASAADSFFDSEDLCIYSCAVDRSCWGCTPINATTYAEVTNCTKLPCTFGCATEQSHPGDEGRVEEIVTYMAIVAAITLVVLFMRGYAKSVHGEKTTLDTRISLFNSFCMRSAAWHDMHRESELDEILGNGALSAQHLTSGTLSVYLAIIAIISGGIAIAFWGCAQLAAIMMVALPALGFAAYFQSITAVGGEDAGAIPELQPSSDIASTIIMNSELLATLGRSADYLEKYCNELDNLRLHYAKASIKAGFAHFMMQSLMFFIFGIAFYIGALFVNDGVCTMDGMLRSILGLVFCAYVSGMQASQLPNAKSAMLSAVKACTVVSEDDVDPDAAATTGKPVDISSGHVVLKDIRFAYPSRPDNPVIQGLNLTIQPGETVALVGGSGSGKSTILLLLQKLYTPQSGSIEIDGVDVALMDTAYLRRQIAVVSQEVRLFDRTILENIAYRPSPDGQTPPEEDRRRNAEVAAGTAHATEFISAKSEGFDFEVGHRGSKLSGGQRQRVAIARAMYSESGGGPQIRLVLLDEATSALDAESEGHVQDALAELQQGRTTVIVAHRLNTVKSADRICVISEGVIAEEGTFDTLMADDSTLFHKFYIEHFEEEEA
eukprot:m.28999 g.28999  ORF g.28999 m.28999 type:complete len:1394 (-) comp4565_c0_seq1:3501-7682(-)